MRFFSVFHKSLTKLVLAGFLVLGVGIAEVPTALAGGGVSDSGPRKSVKKTAPGSAKTSKIRKEIAEVDDQLARALYLAKRYGDRARKADKAADATDAKAAKLNKTRAKNQIQIKKDKAARADLNRRLRSGKNPDGSKMTLRDKDNIVRKSNALGSKIAKAEQQDKADKKAVGKLRQQAKTQRQEARGLRGEQGLQETKAKALKKKRAALRKKL